MTTEERLIRAEVEVKSLHRQVQVLEERLKGQCEANHNQRLGARKLQAQVQRLEHTVAQVLQLIRLELGASQPGEELHDVLQKLELLLIPSNRVLRVGVR